MQIVEEPAVQLIATGPLKQRRLTVAFRPILCVPHAFLLFFLNLAGFAVAFVGWWGALFMGRLPGFAVTYLSGLARWNARYYGYLYLLTDDYPPFTFEDDLAYPVVVAIPPPGRLNRFAVFFRLILAIWANIVSGLVIYGTSTIVALIAWLITLLTGRLPRPLHLAFTAVLRFETRYACYLSMLTSTYPWKLFGDEPVAAAPVTATPAEPTTPADPTTPAPAENPWGQTAPWGQTSPWAETAPPAETPTVSEGAWGSPPAQTAVQPADWRLVLPQSAKALLIVFIVLGLVTDVGLQVLRVATTNRTMNSANVKAAAVSEWNNAFNSLNTALARDSTTNCGQVLSCYTKADASAAASLTTFANEVQAITMPSAAAPDASTVVADARKAAQDFTVVSQVTSPGLYESTYSGTGVSAQLQTLTNEVNTLATTLTNS